MTTRAEVCDEARRWLGTPWVHQGHMKGVGVDCGGLIGGVAVALGIVPADFWQRHFSPFGGYSRMPHGDSLLRVLRAFMFHTDPADAVFGDVVVMRFRRDPQHVGFLVPYQAGGLALVHALNGGSVREVVAHRLDQRWRDRIVAAFAMPGVA